MKVIKISTALLFILLLIPVFTLAQTNDQYNEVMFKAKVIEILDSQEIIHEDGSTSIQQKIRLKGLDEDWKDEEIIFDGTRYDVISSPKYKIGDKVLVSYSQDLEGNEIFYIVDFVRQGLLYLLTLFFAVIVIIVGRMKGLRALIVLLLTFFIILQFIVPRILAGNSPLFISIIGSLLILTLAVYFTEGFKRNSTIAVFSILISLLITGLLSVVFTFITRLSGFVSDEVIYLTGLTGSVLNVKGLLLAGIIIGSLGVLDDVVISQTSLVQELKLADPDLSKKEIYSKAMKVGVSHLSSMVNTLFLAYAGAALPLLILFSINQPPFLTFSDVINNEIVATEIVRTLTGSIGLVLAVPITTFLAVTFLKNVNQSSSHE